MLALVEHFNGEVAPGNISIFPIEQQADSPGQVFTFLLKHHFHCVFLQFCWMR